MATATFEIGANWVTSPHRVLRNIEREFGLAADFPRCRSTEFGRARAHVRCPAETIFLNTLVLLSHKAAWRWLGSKA